MLDFAYKGELILNYLMPLSELIKQQSQLIVHVAVLYRNLELLVIMLTIFKGVQGTVIEVMKICYLLYACVLLYYLQMR